MVSAVILSWIDGALRLSSTERICDWLTPCTCTASSCVTCLVDFFSFAAFLSAALSSAVLCD